MLRSELTQYEYDTLKKYKMLGAEKYLATRNETDAYRTADVLRKEAGMQKAKLKVEDPTTYGNFIYTKEREGSPISAVKIWEQAKQRTENKPADKTLKEGTADVLKTISKPLGAGVSALGRVFDVGSQAMKRGFSGVASIVGAIGYNGKELVDSFIDKRDFSFIRAGEQWEDFNKKIEYLYGVNNNISDVIDFRTSTEKRDEMIKDLPISRQNYLKNNLDGIAMFTDVATGIMSGVGIAGALGKIATLGKAGVIAGAVAGVAPKLGKAGQLAVKSAPYVSSTIAKTATVLEKTINMSGSNMAKLGATISALAVPYYGLTGKRIFDDAGGATNEGAMVLLGGGVLKGLGVGASKLVKNVGPLKEGIDTVFGNGIKTNKVQTEQPAWLKEAEDASNNKTLLQKEGAPEWLNKAKEDAGISDDAINEATSEKNIINELFADKEFQEGVKLFNETIKTETKKVPKTISTAERKKIRTALFELVGQNELKNEPGISKFDTPDFHPKYDNIDFLEKEGIIENKGVVISKSGKETYSYEYTEAGLEFIPKGIKARIAKGEKIGFHHDKEFVDKMKGEGKVYKSAKAEAPNKKEKTKTMALSSSTTAKGSDDIIEEFVRADVVADPKMSTIENVDEVVQIMKENEIAKNKKRRTFVDSLIDNGEWDDKKSRFTNILQGTINRTKRLFVKTEKRMLGELGGDKTVSFLLKPANRKIKKELEVTGLLGKQSKFRREFTAIEKALGSDYEEFSQFLVMKSRLEKTIEAESKGEELLTSFLNKDGTRTTLTKHDLAKIVQNGEGKYSELEKRVRAINDEILDYEVSVGARSQSSVDIYREMNPSYIPDKLTADDVLQFKKNKEFKAELTSTKSLKGGTDEFDYSMNGLDNLYQNIALRLEQAGRIDEINTAFKIMEPLGIMRKFGKNDKLKRGEDIVKTMIDGNAVDVVMPKFYSEMLKEEDQLSRSLVMKTLSISAMITKEFATGRANPIFQLSAITWETIGGISKIIANKGSPLTYIKSMLPKILGTNLYKTEVGKKALRDLMGFSGADFTYYDYIRKEFEANMGIGEKVMGKPAKVIEYAMKALDFGHAIEVNTTRDPVFQTMLRKQGLNQKEFEKLAIEANGDTVKLTQLLADRGIDYKQASSTARSLFNYSIAKKTVREVSRVLPYLNSAVSNITAQKDLFEDNPKAYISFLTVASIVANQMVAYNTGTQDWLGLQQADPEKTDAMRKQADYVKYKVGLTNFTDDKVLISEIGRNIPQLEWLYPMLFEKAMNGEVITEKSVNKIFKDFTYFGDLTKPYNIDLGKVLPGGIKQFAEVATNYDLFKGRQLVPESVKMSGLKTEEFTKTTNDIYIKYARWYALMTGGELQDGGIIEGGRQLSPIVLEKWASVVDPLGTMGKMIRAGLHNLENEDSAEKVKKTGEDLLRLLSGGKSYYRNEVDYALFETGEEENEYEKAVKLRMKSVVDGAKDVSELNGKMEQILNEFKDSPNFESKKKTTIKNLFTDKEIELTMGKELFSEYKMDTTDLALYYHSILKEDGEEAFASKMQGLKKLSDAGYFSDKRMKNFGEKMDELYSK